MSLLPPSRWTLEQHTTGVNGAPRTKAWALPLEGDSEISASLFPPLLLVSQGAVCYTQPCETLSFCQKKCAV